MAGVGALRWARTIVVQQVDRHRPHRGDEKPRRYFCLGGLLEVVGQTEQPPIGLTHVDEEDQNRLVCEIAR